MTYNGHDVTTTGSTGVVRSRLKHVPTPEQVQALARFNGGEVCSYLLDPTANYVPLELCCRYWRELGQHGLCFTRRDQAGFVTMELVVTPTGRGFDLLDGRDLLLERGAADPRRLKPPTPARCPPNRGRASAERPDPGRGRPPRRAPPLLSRGRPRWRERQPKPRHL